MIKRIAAVSILLLGVAWAAVSAPIDMHLDLAAGDTFVMHTETEQTIKEEVYGFKISFRQWIKTEYAYRVVTAAPDDTYELEVTINNMEVKIDSLDGDIGVERLGGMSALMEESFSAILEKQLPGETFFIQITDKGVIEEIEGLEGVVDRLMRVFETETAGTAPAREDLEGFMGDEFFTNAWRFMFSYIAPNPVSAGQTWEAVFTRSVQFPVTISAVYTLTNITDEALFIESEGVISSSDKLHDSASGRFQIEYSFSGKQGGSLLVDPETNWLTSMEMEQSIRGELLLFSKAEVKAGEDGTIELPSETVPAGKIPMEIETRVKVY